MSLAERGTTVNMRAISGFRPAEHTSAQLL